MGKTIFIPLLAASCLAWVAPAWADTGSATLEEWQTFDIGAQESLNFDQPAVDSIVAIRILDDAPTLIEGSLTSNGSLFLVNTNGFTLEAGSHITVGSLFLATDPFAYDRFLAGTWGTGSIAEGGNISLAGTINADSVGMWAGGSISLLSGGSIVSNWVYLESNQITLNGSIAFSDLTSDDEVLQADPSKLVVWDEFVISPIPEPESWTMLLAGLGLIARRRIHFS